MKELDRLLEIIDRLRGPSGCPWDRVQTLKTLRPQLLDEAYEVLAAINTRDAGNLEEELGDLLFGILMFCRVAEAEAGIPLDRVARGIEAKIVRRHPHVFGPVKVKGVGDVVRNWEKIKSREKRKVPAKTIFSDSLKHLPALRRAQRIQEKARKSGFDWEEVSGVIDKIHEELEEVKAEIKSGRAVRQEEELGDLLFSVVNLVRFLGFDSELALQKMIDRWVARFRKLELRLEKEGKDLGKVSFREMDDLWEEIAESEK